MERQTRYTTHFPSDDPSDENPAAASRASDTRTRRDIEPKIGARRLYKK
jgi:hypothetical protein